MSNRLTSEVNQMYRSETQINTAMTIRRVDVTDGDRKRLTKLADLDSRSVPTGPVLGAEVDGRLVAAIALDGGGLIADPFQPTSELQALLKLRAAQMRERPRRRQRGSRLIGRRARLALGGSPAGQIISLPRTH